jgi:hypothetical protein
MSLAAKQEAYKEFVVERMTIEDEGDAEFNWKEILKKVMHNDVLDHIWREPPTSEK